MKILFVCLGNICRSPTAEVVFRAVASREAPELSLEIDSAGTAGYHVGEAPDRRTREAAARRGYDLSALRARALERRAPTHARERLRLFLEFAPDAGVSEVPDPYYGGPNGFEHVLDLIESAARGL